MTPALRWYRKQAAINRGRGLTVNGKPYRRRRNFSTAAERINARRQRGLDAWNKRVAKRAAAGLTTRGKIKTNLLIGQPTRLILISQIDKIAAAIFDVYPCFPPGLQELTKNLSQALSELRQKCL